MVDLTVRTVIDNTLLFLRDRKTAYSLKFGAKDGATRMIMADLVRFCHWQEGAFHKDQRITDRLLGRQDVLRRINEHIGLTDRQLMVLYNGGPIPDLIEENEDDR